ncbi:MULTISPECIES: hypothetical protein [Kitasatospora]|uniref:Uncharacterized protein n=1 Tax=Kitasatospora cystarginea TaxID=58350 RepID=A0ABP5RV40_9ACTN
MALAVVAGLPVVVARAFDGLVRTWRFTDLRHGEERSDLYRVRSVAPVGGGGLLVGFGAELALLTWRNAG